MGFETHLTSECRNKCGEFLMTRGKLAIREVPIMI